MDSILKKKGGRSKKSRRIFGSWCDHSPSDAFRLRATWIIISNTLLQINQYLPELGFSVLSVEL